MHCSSFDHVVAVAVLIMSSISCAAARGQEAAGPAMRDVPATAPAARELPHVAVDVARREVRVACKALDVDAPLEFFCVVSGTSEHESVLRTEARPSHLHLALLMVGLEPGEPVRYSEQDQSWLPPRGAPVRIDVEYEKDGQLLREPASSWMREIRTGEPMPERAWVFAGSRTMEDGNYAADVTGYVVSVVNFDLTVIDIPQIASNANETLEWERNPDRAPPLGTKVTMILSPGKGADAGPATTPATPTTQDARGNGRIDMPLVVIDAAGRITVNDIHVSPDELTRRLIEMQAERPVRVRLTAHPQVNERTRNDAIAAVQAADVPLEVIDSTEPDAQQAGRRE